MHRMVRKNMVIYLKKFTLDHMERVNSKLALQQTSFSSLMLESSTVCSCLGSSQGAPSDSVSSILRIHWYLFSANILDISSEHSPKHDSFLPVGFQFLIWSTSMVHLDGSTSIPSVLCSSGSNGWPRSDFFKLVLPARSWPTINIRARQTLTDPSFRASS